jgi:hypothetical protein
MDIQKDLVFNPALQHIEWYLYAIHVIASFPCSTTSKQNTIGLRTQHRGVQISVKFIDTLGKYDISIFQTTIAVAPKIDAVSVIEKLIHEIDSLYFFELLLGRITGYKNLLEIVGVADSIGVRPLSKRL